MKEWISDAFRILNGLVDKIDLSLPNIILFSADEFVEYAESLDTDELNDVLNDLNKFKEFGSIILKRKIQQSVFDVKIVNYNG